MNNINKLLRSTLSEVFNNDQRVIRAFEKLFALDTDQSESTELIEIVTIEAGNASARAQQALDQLAIKKQYGDFFDSTNQTAAAINTPKAVVFNNTNSSQGIEIDSGVASRLNISRTGKYKIDVRVQL